MSGNGIHAVKSEVGLCIRVFCMWFFKKLALFLFQDVFVLFLCVIRACAHANRMNQVRIRELRDLENLEFLETKGRK